MPTILSGRTVSAIIPARHARRINHPELADQQVVLTVDFNTNQVVQIEFAGVMLGELHSNFGEAWDFQNLNDLGSR